MLINKLSDYSFGGTIGKVDSILDSNLVTIKLTNLDVMRGSNLICVGRGYEYDAGNLQTARKSLNTFISDGMIIYDYFVKKALKLSCILTLLHKIEAIPTCNKIQPELEERSIWYFGFSKISP